MYQPAIEKYLFCEAWMIEFEKIWNGRENHSAQSALAKIGKVSFLIGGDDGVTRGTLVDWGADGKISFTCHAGDNNTVPAFLAQSRVWDSVICSYYSTIQAVVDRKMEFRGKMRFATSFSQKFNMIADVALYVNMKFADR